MEWESRALVSALCRSVLRGFICGYRAGHWIQSRVVFYPAGVPIGQVWTGSPLSAQWR